MKREIIFIFIIFLSIGFILQKTTIYQQTLNLLTNKKLKGKMRKKPSKKLYRAFYGFGFAIVLISLLNTKYSIPLFLESIVIFAPILYAIFTLKKLNKDSSLETIVDIIYAGLISILSTIALFFI